jgi:hypothetical protein
MDRPRFAPDIGFNRNLSGMKPLQNFDQLRDFLLALNPWGPDNGQRKPHLDE